MITNNIKDLQELCETQVAQIFSLQQEINKLKEKLKQKEIKKEDMSDEEWIALNELKKLKIKSEAEILTYEEAKKVELYFKVIRTIRTPEQKEQEENKKYSTEELLSQISLDK